MKPVIIPRLWPPHTNPPPSVPKDRLLRGVPVPHLLRGGMRIMEPLRFDLYTPEEGDSLFSQSNTVSDDAYLLPTSVAMCPTPFTDYRRSPPQVDRFDDFLSHSWRTSPWEKAIALRVLYNGRPAAVASTSVAFVFFLLSRSDSLLPAMDPTHYSASVGADVPLSAYSCITGAVTFFFLLAYWQDVRAFALGHCCGGGGSALGGRRRESRARMAFFDKISIHQTDPALKPAGIRSLGGFLRVSDRFVILWHSDYFTRLWCLYELAAFEFIQRQRRLRRGRGHDCSGDVEAAHGDGDHESGSGSADEDDDDSAMLFVPCPLAVIVFVCLCSLFAAAGIFFPVLLTTPALSPSSSGNLVECVLPAEML